MLPPRDDIRVEFTGRNPTKFGGNPFLRKFLIRFGVKEKLENAVTIEKRDSRFATGGMLACLLYAVILDMKRQSDTPMLRLDKVFQKNDDQPLQSTISRFPKRFRGKA